LILTSVRYFLFCTIILMKKEARAMEKAILANIPQLLTCKKSGLELGLAQAAGPLGNLAAGKS
jgi:hypothetical protein